jgi:hypothetical protein
MDALRRLLSPWPLDVLRLSPPWWWSLGVHSPEYSLRLVPAKETPDRAALDNAGRIWILAGRNDFYRRRPKPFIFGLQSWLTAYELAMALDGRHPYSVRFSLGTGTGVEDDRRDDLRIAAIGDSDKSQRIYDATKRLKSVPTSSTPWICGPDGCQIVGDTGTGTARGTDETSVFKVADAIEVILAELADELAPLGDGGVIGWLQTQRDTAKAESAARAAPAEKGQAVLRRETKTAAFKAWFYEGNKNRPIPKGPDFSKLRKAFQTATKKSISTSTARRALGLKK